MRTASGVDVEVEDGMVSCVSSMRNLASWSVKAFVLVLVAESVERRSISLNFMASLLGRSSGDC